MEPALVQGRRATSPSTAAAARWRERRGGPGGLRGPDRPSCTSCRCGALKGFARARCATDENILLQGRQDGGETRRRAMSQEPPRDVPGSAPLRRSQLLPQGRRARPGPTAKAAAHKGLKAPRPAPSAGRPGRAHLPKMADTQPLAGQGCGSQRPNVLPARRSVPFARRHRDARRASLRYSPLICGEERRARTSSRPPSNPIPAPVQP